MTKIISGATMSLDGYIAGPEESGFDRLFQWYGNGDVELPSANPGISFRLTEASAKHWREVLETTGALVVGRHLFDITSGWGGRHPIGVPVVVLTHRVPDDFESESFVFVTEGGIEAAVAKARELAGDKDVVVNGGQMAEQALQAGLLDEIGVDLVPVLLGGGTPFFDALGAPVDLEGPISTIQGDRVTHLRYRVVGQ
ncbi:dihydrofolate reductase family protein [Solirubrobacter soli]|uniref:dihydrofolate reductase family protein n=1 Tax=Solirubrobacter soli TaxID=363832 RepID=UPI000404754A|nr:dihydrofolate reductase family protein [Solirubrobacter soli]